MNRRAAILLAALLAGCCPALPRWTASPEASPEQLQWRVAVPQPRQTLAAGEALTWKLAPRRDDRAEAGCPCYGVVALPVRAGESLRLDATASRGVVVLAISDRPRHPRDPSPPSTPTDSFPGHPIAFAVGAPGGAATLSLSAAHDGVWQAWAWVLPGPLAPPVELDAPTNAELAPLGLDPAALRLLARFAIPADVDRAWLARVTDLDHPTSLRRATVTLRRTETPEAPPPRDLTRDWLAAADPDGLAADPELQAWLTALATLDERRGFGVRRGRVWSAGGFSPGDELAATSQGRTLLAWSQHPIAARALLRRARLWEAAPPEQVEERLLAELAAPDDDATELRRRLGELLPRVGGLDASIYDAHGHLVTSTSPFALASVADRPLWPELARAAAPRISPPIERIGLGFATRGVAVPIGGDRKLGWLLIELYAGPARTSR